MFNKNQSIEDYVAKNIKPEVEKEIKLEEKINQPVKTKKEKINYLKQERKYQKLIDQKKLELSFEVKAVREKIPEIEEVRSQLDKGD